MPTVVLAIVVAAATAVVLAARIRVGFAIVVASSVLIPAPLVVANPVTHYASVTRILVIALAVRLLLARRQRQDERAPRGIWRWTPVHSAITVFLACAFVAGVALATKSAAAGRLDNALLSLAELLVFFAVMLAAVRAIGDLRWILAVVSLTLLASAGIGIVEHVTGDSWGHWLFRHARVPSTAADPLEERAGSVRVRAGSEYALQYGWVVVMLLPALLGWLAGWRAPVRRWLPVTVLALGVVLVALYWSYSRTALAAVGGVALLTAVAARDVRLLRLGAAGVVIGVVGFFTVASLQHGFVGLPSGYVSVRTERLPTILQVTAAAGPLHGLGLGELATYGYPSTDTTYLQLYGETGLLGLVSGLGLLVTAAACCVPGLRSRVAADRLAAAAGLAAGVAMLAGGFAYDALRSLSSAHPFLVLAAVGLAASERVVGPLPGLVPRGRWLVVGAVVGAEALGWLVFALTPEHYAQQFRFSTVSAVRESHPYDPVITGQTFVHTICGLAAALPAGTPAAHIDCRDLQLGAGVGVLRVQAATPMAVRSVAEAVDTQVATLGLTSFTTSPESSVQRGRPTAAAWAPFWLPAATLLGLMLVPVHRGRSGDTSAALGTM